MTTVDVVAVRMSVCPVCHEFTRDPARCEHRLPEPPPMPATAIQVPVWLKGCGHVEGDPCDCLQVETAGYARLR